MGSNASGKKNCAQDFTCKAKIGFPVYISNQMKTKRELVTILPVIHDSKWSGIKNRLPHLPTYIPDGDTKTGWYQSSMTCKRFADDA
eukprot:2469778-Amphidinium_carterae.2